MVNSPQDGLTHLVITNMSGLTQRVKEGTVIGEAQTAEVLTSEPVPGNTPSADIRRLSSLRDEEKKEAARDAASNRCTVGSKKKFPFATRATERSFPFRSRSINVQRPFNCRVTSVLLKRPFRSRSVPVQLTFNCRATSVLYYNLIRTEHGFYRLYQEKDTSLPWPRFMRSHNCQTTGR